MADPCIENTNTLHLSTDVDGNLSGDVQLEPINEGSLEVDANGIGVTVHPTGALQHTTAGLAVKQAQGVFVGSEGLMKVNNYVSTGSNLNTNATNPNVGIGRGSTFQVGSTLTLPLSLPSNNLASYLHLHARWRGRWTTNLSAFSGTLLDSVFAYLQLNLDNTGWGTHDQASIEYSDMSGSFALDATFSFAAANNTAHTFQSRLLVAGGTTSGSATQGQLYTEYGSFLECLY